jgi:predicted SprT family Zn-dependent metalloprotease
MKVDETPFVLSYTKVSQARLRLLVSLAKEFNVSFRVFDYSILETENGEYNGMAHLAHSEVWLSIDKGISNERLYSTVYHEICHILCTRAGKYKRFHLEDYMDNALRAERYVDALACEMMRRRHPNLEFVFNYEKPYPVSSLQKESIVEDMENVEYAELKVDPRARKPKGAVHLVLLGDP